MQKQIKIAFRVDGGSQIGIGHLMRCLTLAKELSSRGAYIKFISRTLPENLKKLCNECVDDFAEVDSLDISMDSGKSGDIQIIDARETGKCLSGTNWDWLIVDHYGLDEKWESVMRNFSRKIMVVDDLANRQHNCEILLDQNFYLDSERRYIGKVPDHCKLLVGPRYALLRNEFRYNRQKVKPRSGKIGRILVSFGGSDTENYTGKTIDALHSIDKTFVVDVVIGANHPDCDEILRSCNKFGFNCHVQSANMADLMVEADLSIGAGGSTTWERMCLGLPSVTFCLADNQKQLITDASQSGLLLHYDLPIKQLSDYLQDLFNNNTLLNDISVKSMSIVDGRGVLRVTKHIGCTGVTVRRAAIDDSRNIYDWRNNPAIRHISRNQDPILWENHCKWFSSVLTDNQRILLIGSRDGTDIGVVRFDINSDEAEVSIYLVPGIKADGAGSALLQSAEQWLYHNCPVIRVINAEVLDGNIPSLGLFKGMDYKFKGKFFSKLVSDITLL